MADIASWNGHEFRVDPQLIYTFDSLTIKTSSETKDKTSSKQKYVSRSNSKPYEISFSISLDARLGVESVKGEAMTLCEEAREGATDYFYFGGEKMVNCKFMITEAVVENIEMLPNGLWTRCNVKCTFKQCEKITAEGTNNSSGGGSSGGGGSSRKKSGGSAVNAKAVLATGVTEGVTAASKAISKTTAASYVTKTVNAAKAASKTQKTSDLKNRRKASKI